MYNAILLATLILGGLWLIASHWTFLLELLTDTVLMTAAYIVWMVPVGLLAVFLYYVCGVR